MANVVVVLLIDTPSPQLKSVLGLQSGAGKENTVRLGNLVNGLANGTLGRGTAKVVTDTVAATSTLTFTGAPVNNETFVLNGVTFTAKTSGAVANEFNIGGSVTATAQNVVTAVNASVTAGVAGVVSAANSAGVVTFTALVPGKSGNGYTISETLSNATAVAWAGGSENQNLTFTL